MSSHKCERSPSSAPQLASARYLTVMSDCGVREENMRCGECSTVKQTNSAANLDALCPTVLSTEDLGHSHLADPGRHNLAANLVLIDLYRL